MAYFEKVGEGNHSVPVNGMMGGPTTTLAMWLENRYFQTHPRVNAGEESGQLFSRDSEALASRVPVEFPARDIRH
jgi:hypothetical protein